MLLVVAVFWVSCESDVDDDCNSRAEGKDRRREDDNDSARFRRRLDDAVILVEDDDVVVDVVFAVVALLPSSEAEGVVSEPAFRPVAG